MMSHNIEEMPEDVFGGEGIDEETEETDEVCYVITVSRVCTDTMHH